MLNEILIASGNRSNEDLENTVIETELMSPSKEIIYPMLKVREEILTALRRANVDEEIISKLTIGEAPEGIEGDFGFHCATLARILRKSPLLIAKELVESLSVEDGGFITKYSAEGPYVNASLDYERFATEVCMQVIELGADYGKEKIGMGQRVVVDMSSPNIAKRMSIGHLRSTIIGDSLAKIFHHLDYEVIKDNHIGDWGTQFGHLLRAIELWGDPEVITKNPIEELQKLYVRISDAGDPKSEIYAGLPLEEAEVLAKQTKDEGRAWFKKLEDGDLETREKWQQIVDLSLRDFQKMYDVLGVKFDWTRGESFYESMLPKTIAKLQESGITIESEGATIIDMEDVGLGSAIVQKSDGATLYLTREIATGIHRSDTEKIDKMIYVVGEDQKFYFEQFFEILKRMGYPIGENSKHVYFGMIRMAEGKMSTRKGRVVLLEDVIAEAMERTKLLIQSKNPKALETNGETLISQIAIGALKWNDLVADPKRSIVFDWDEILSMDGNSAPYVQYSFVRAISLLENAPVDFESELNICPEHDVEKTLVRLISAFPEAIKMAGESYNPSRLANSIYELSKAFNSFYHSVPVLREENPSKRLSRLILTASVAQTIETGLSLLGIEAPSKM